jgi:hypothetical protein
MYNLKALAGILVRLPLGDRKRPALRAGPPFQMPYTLVPPSPEKNFWRMQTDLLVASEGLVKKLLDSRSQGREVATADGIRYLEALRQLDHNALAWIERVQDGITPSRSTRP